MSRLSLQIKTIKTLFGKSGNQCAFPECTQAIIEDDAIIGEICHIEAACEGGERYNPNQTDHERRSEKNLILLCANHPLITNDTSVYTVEFLQKMKQKHESRNLGVNANISDKNTEKLILNYSQEVTNNITNSGTMTVYQNFGISSVEDIATLFNTLFAANFPKINEMAMRSAVTHVNRFAHILISSLKKAGINLDELELAFIDPDMQYIFNSTIETVARSGDDSLISIIVKLIIQRIRINSEQKKQLFNEAILTVNKLTKNQLDILTVSFLLYENIKNIYVNSWGELNNYFNKSIESLIKFEVNQMDLRHIQYSGCAGYSCGIGRPSWPQLHKGMKSVIAIISYIPLSFRDKILSISKG